MYIGIPAIKPAACRDWCGPAVDGVVWI